MSRDLISYVVVAFLAMTVLLYAVVEQVYDANFYVLWESTALLAGDRPYRDFYLTGWPLQSLISTTMQWVTGYRLIGEFLIHWSVILASILLGFHLALRLSGSIAASFATIVIALLATASMEWFQYPKLFVYAVAVVVGWGYIDRPGPRRAAAAGVVTAAAFLLRHDHGVYVGAIFALAFGLARAATPFSRTGRAMIRDARVYAVVGALIVAPWALLVHLNEGLLDFVRTRVEWGRVWAPPAGSPYDVLWDFSPPRLVSQLAGPSWPPSREHTLVWLVQVTLLLPILALVRVGVDLLVWCWGRRPMRLHTAATILAATTSSVAASRLLREESYYVAVLPLSAALGAQLLVGRSFKAPALFPGVAFLWGTRAWRAARCALAAGVLLITSIAAAGTLNTDLFSPNELEELRVTYRQLLSSPPIDEFQPSGEAHQVDSAAWQASNADTRQKIMIRYLYECTREGDRLLVTGSTPYQVGYYAERPIAGGHLQWHHRWRSDPLHEQQSLVLIERQSVPFAFSTHDPVLSDFAAYPRIHAHLEEYYVEVEGTGGLLLVDTRRKPTARFGRLGWPCFR